MIPKELPPDFKYEYKAEDGEIFEVDISSALFPNYFATQSNFEEKQNKEKSETRYKIRNIEDKAKKSSFEQFLCLLKSEKENQKTFLQQELKCGIVSELKGYLNFFLSMLIDDSFVRGICEELFFPPNLNLEQMKELYVFSKAYKKFREEFDNTDIILPGEIEFGLNLYNFYYEKLERESETEKIFQSSTFGLLEKCIFNYAFLFSADMSSRIYKELIKFLDTYEKMNMKDDFIKNYKDPTHDSSTLFLKKKKLTGHLTCLLSLKEKEDTIYMKRIIISLAQKSNIFLVSSYRIGQINHFYIQNSNNRDDFRGIWSFASTSCIELKKKTSYKRFAIFKFSKASINL